MLEIPIDSGKITDSYILNQNFEEKVEENVWKVHQTFEIKDRNFKEFERKNDEKALKFPDIDLKIL